MNYCGSPIYCSDTRFLEQFETINSQPVDVGHVEKEFKYNPENDVDVSLGIRPFTNNNSENKQLRQSRWWVFW